MRLFFSVFMATLLLPALCFAEPLATDDIVNQPAIMQPEGSLKGTVEDSLNDSVEVLMPATPVGALPAHNATLSDVNATLPSINATLPSINATLPIHNATLPSVNAILPSANATHPALPIQITVPSQKVPVITSATQPKPISVADFLVKAPEKAPEPIKQEPKKKEPVKSEPKKPESKKQSQSSRSHKSQSQVRGLKFHQTPPKQEMFRFCKAAGVGNVQNTAPSAWLQSVSVSTIPV